MFDQNSIKGEILIFCVICEGKTYFLLLFVFFYQSTHFKCSALCRKNLICILNFIRQQIKRVMGLFRQRITRFDILLLDLGMVGPVYGRVSQAWRNDGLSSSLWVRVSSVLKDEKAHHLSQSQFLSYTGIYIEAKVVNLSPCIFFLRMSITWTDSR